MASDERQETVDDICQKIRDAGIPELADHILAAWKRERAEIEAQALSIGGIVEASRHTQKPQGNAAAMREALENIAGYAETARCHTEDAHILSFLGEIEGWARSALSAPARNCDMYDSYGDAIRAFEESENAEDYEEMAEWLFAPAAERKGDDDENK